MVGLQEVLPKFSLQMGAILRVVAVWSFLNKFVCDCNFDGQGPCRLCPKVSLLSIRIVHQKKTLGRDDQRFNFVVFLQPEHGICFPCSCKAHNFAFLSFTSAWHDNAQEVVGSLWFSRGTGVFLPKQKGKFSPAATNADGLELVEKNRCRC